MVRPHHPGTARDLHHQLADWWGFAHADRLISTWAEPRGDHYDPPAQKSALPAPDTYLVTDEER